MEILQAAIVKRMKLLSPSDDAADQMLLIEQPELSISMTKFLSVLVA